MESVTNTSNAIYLDSATGSIVDSGNHKCLIGYLFACLDYGTITFLELKAKA